MNKLDEINSKVSDLRLMLKDFMSGKYLKPKPRRRLSMLEVAEVVGKFFDVTVKQMRSDCRHGDIMKARHMARYIMQTEFHYTPRQVSAFIKCHRTTTYNTIHKTENWLALDNKFKQLYQFIMEEINQKSENSYSVDNYSKSIKQQ